MTQPNTPAAQAAALAAQAATLAAQAAALVAQVVTPVASPDTPKATTDAPVTAPAIPPATATTPVTVPAASSAEPVASPDTPKAASAAPVVAPAVPPATPTPTVAVPAASPGTPVVQPAVPVASLGAPATPPAAPIAPQQKKKSLLKKVLIGVAIVVVVAVITIVVWMKLKPSGPGEGFISGNGRIEATEIDVATKLAGRVQDIMVNEGDFVQAGQPLAQMQINVLEAQRDEARAQSRQAVTAVASAEAMVSQRESEVDAAERRFTRSEKLSPSGAVALQEFDDDRAHLRGAQAAIKVAQAQVVNANAGVVASEASIARIEADIQDSLLKSPRDGRVQYLVAQSGEVLAGGGKVLNLVDLSDVYITFFLPETAVGKVALDSDVHIVLDAAPQYVIPAKVSYVSSTAQFTPKTVETASERQKLMFRVKARISRELLQKHVKVVKTGLPGVAWLKLDPKIQWPTNLEIKVPE